MDAALTEIWRHPIKSLGRETLDRVTLAPDQWVPGDRQWAVTHEKAEINGPGWARCQNFLRCANGPGLMAVTSFFDDKTGTLRLQHPEADPLEIDPFNAAHTPRLLDWLGAIWPPDMPAPTGLHSYAGGLTDNPDPFISINNTASHRAVEERVGKPLSHLRWRGNLWIDGLGPWQEFEWIGKDIRIGAAILRVEERIERCRATMANPETGRRDADTLAALDTWGHRDFGVFGRVLQGSEIASGDPVVVPA